MDDEKSFSGKRKPGTVKKQSHFQFYNEKRKRRNSAHDHSSATPEVIDTVYRILCPVKKIGSVLGKGGDIINALRNETRAKIRVADAIPGAEERVIIIYSYPLEQSGRLDTGEDPGNTNNSEKESEEMLLHCPAQDALLKVHDRIAAGEVLRDGVIHERTDPDDIVTARILVPNNQVGCLLGKGGGVIKNLRSETNANIRILPAEHLPPCAMDTDELVQISGMAAVVKKALYEISTLLHQHPRKENPSVEDLVYASMHGSCRSGAPLPPQGNSMRSHLHLDAHVTPQMPWFDGRGNESFGYGPASFDSHHLGNDGEKAEEFSMRILCATGKIGGVIGKGGAVVKQLEQQTGARIKVEDTAPTDEERVILVTSTEAPWDQISPTIEAVLQLQSRTNAASEDGTITTRLLVPSSKVGCILGQGGNIISEIRRRTRADIRVYSKDKPKYIPNNEELVQISGNLNVATEALVEIASRLRTRTFRAGNAAVNPSPSAPLYGFSPSESISSRRQPSYDMIGAGNTGSYEHSKGPVPRYEAQGYPDPPNATGYAVRPRYEARGYSDLPPATGYSAGPRHGAQAYPGPPTATAYSTGSRHEAQAYPDPSTVTGYTTGPRHESQTYSGLPTATGYSTGPRHESRVYQRPATGYSPEPGHEAEAYPGPPNASGYSAGQKYQAQTYPVPQTATGYPNINSYVEVKIPASAVPSVIGVGGSNISDIRQISGARVKLQDPHSGASECVVEIHGSSEQMKAAQCLLQSFINTGSQSAPSARVPHY